MLLEVEMTICQHWLWVATEWVWNKLSEPVHYSGAIMIAMASQITGFSIFLVNHFCRRRSKKTSKSPASLAFVRGIHQWSASKRGNVSSWWRHHGWHKFKDVYTTRLYYVMLTIPLSDNVLLRFGLIGFLLPLMLSMGTRYPRFQTCFVLFICHVLIYDIFETTEEP